MTASLTGLAQYKQKIRGSQRGKTSPVRFRNQACLPAWLPSCLLIHLHRNTHIRHTDTHETHRHTQSDSLVYMNTLIDKDIVIHIETQTLIHIQSHT